MSIPVMPTLGSTGFVHEPVEIMAYLLRHYASAPKSQTVTWFDEAISLKDDLAQFATAQEGALESQMSNVLTAALARITGETPSVTVTRTTLDNGYNLTITMAVPYDGDVHTLNQNVGIDEQGYITYDVNQ